MNGKELLRLTGIPIVIASLCCLAPIIVVLFGLGSVGVAVSLTSVLDGQYRWVFLLAGVLALCISLVLYFRKRGICNLTQAKKRQNEVINTVVIVSSIAAVGYVVFFYGVLPSWVNFLVFGSSLNMLFLLFTILL
jgi:hypothetical protein